jgi:hypothetical protein
MLSVNEQLERIVEVAIVLLVGAMISTGYWSVEGLLLAAVLFVVIRPLAVWIGVREAGAGDAPRRLLAWFGHSRHRLGYYAVYFAGLTPRCRRHGSAVRGVPVIAASIVLRDFRRTADGAVSRAPQLGRRPEIPVSDK